MIPLVRRGLVALTAASLLGAGHGASAEDEAALAELARKTQNPISSMISLPFESTFNFTNGRDDATQ